MPVANGMFRNRRLRGDNVLRDRSLKIVTGNIIAQNIKIFKAVQEAARRDGMPAELPDPAADPEQADGAQKSGPQ